MTRRIAIVVGHPDPDPKRLCRALAQAYADSAEKAGHHVELIDLGHLEVPFLRSQTEFETQPVPENLRPAQQAVLEADHLVLVFPLWLGNVPALLKAFLEQCLRPGAAFEYLPDGKVRLLMKGKSAHIVVTMGMPAIAYRLWYLAHGIRALDRNILAFVGYKPVRTTLLGMVAAAGEGTRRRWLDRMATWGKRGG